MTPDNEKAFIEWLNLQMEWCDRLSLCKEEPGGVTDDNIRHSKDVLKIVKEKFLTLTPTP